MQEYNSDRYYRKSTYKHSRLDSRVSSRLKCGHSVLFIRAHGPRRGALHPVFVGGKIRGQVQSAEFNQIGSGGAQVPI